tara:strand:+ start:3264 stop:4841 length:1578 start_codon:yes stop_codon:yes gene_type:complete
MSFTGYINSRTDIELSPSQKKAVDKISTFLQDKRGPQCFILRGCAGSGKTFLGALLKAYDPKRSYIFTPTGRAAKVVRSMVRKNEDRENISTIHHGIYQQYSYIERYIHGEPRKPENLKSSVSKFKLRNNNNSSDTIYICDESSMISDRKSFTQGLEFGSGDLLFDLFDHVGERKIIFIGDNAQLTPIKMYKSPALDSKYLESKFNIEVQECELNEIMRQNKGSGILENANKVRNNIFNNSQNKTLSEFDDVRFMEKKDAINSCVEKFDPKIFSNFTVVTHTRKLCQKYNLSIRERILPKIENAIAEGDRFVCGQTNYKDKIWNGELLRIKKVFYGEDDRIVKLIKLRPTKSEKKYNKELIKDDGRIHIWLSYQRAEVEYHDVLGVRDLKTLYILENPLFSDDLTMSSIERRAHLVEFYIRFEDSKKKYMENNNKVSLSNYEIDIARRNGGIINREDDPLYNALICKYGYALTAHKAQGGEWDTAIVDFDTKFPDSKSVEYLRWIYTAMTRAKKDLFIINSDKSI